MGYYHTPITCNVCCLTLIITKIIHVPILLNWFLLDVNIYKVPYTYTDIVSLVKYDNVSLNFNLLERFCNNKQKNLHKNMITFSEQFCDLALVKKTKDEDSKMLF